MRLTIVTGAFYPTPPAPCGAMERLMADMAHRLAERGHEVTVLSRQWPGQRPEESVGGVRYVRRAGYTHTRSIKFDLLQDLRYSWRMLWNLPVSDVIVTNVFWLPWLIGRLRPGRGAVFVNVNRWPKGQMKLYLKARGLMAASSAIRDEIARQCPAAAAITRVYPNPIDSEVFRPVARPTPRPPTVLYTGRIHPEKGLVRLVEAFIDVHRQRPDARLRLIGPWRIEDGGGGEAFVGELRRRAAGGPVSIEEPIYDRPRLAEALAAADVYCYPSEASRGEALPVAPLEAMATGLPVVVSGLGVFRDYLEPDVTGLVFDHEAVDATAQLTARLLWCIDRPVDAGAMGRRAAERAAAYGYGRIADQWIAGFREQLALA